MQDDAPVCVVVVIVGKVRRGPAADWLADVLCRRDNQREQHEYNDSQQTVETICGVVVVTSLRQLDRVDLSQTQK